MSDKLYAARKPWDLEPHFGKHRLALTAESPHSKFEIAKEFAYRDQRIEQLEKELSRYTRMSESGETIGDALDMREELSRYRPVVEAARSHCMDRIYCSCAICAAIRKLDGGE